MQDTIYQYTQEWHAGSGIQVPIGDTPSDVHIAVILPVGTNPTLEKKIEFRYAYPIFSRILYRYVEANQLNFAMA